MTQACPAEAQSTLDARRQGKQMEPADVTWECSHCKQTTSKELPANFCGRVRCGLGLKVQFPLQRGLTLARQHSVHHISRRRSGRSGTIAHCFLRTSSPVTSVRQLRMREQSNLEAYETSAISSEPSAARSGVVFQNFRN